MAARRTKSRTQTVVMTGIAGRFGRMLARELHGDHRIIGIDPRGSHHMPKDVTVHSLDVRRKKAEDIFRRNRIDAVIHMNPTAAWSGSDKEHQNLAVVGTHKILDYCQKYEVPKLVLLSTASVYGARPDNNQFLTEDAPLLAPSHFQAMRDLVEVDMYANSFFWRHPEVDTVILRPVHVVGRLQNAESKYLRMKWTPILAGYDPMVQIMSPEDLIHSIRLALRPGIRGVFNVAGPGPVPLTALVRMLGHRPVPLPESAARRMLRVLGDIGSSAVSASELDYLKYVCMVDGERARNVLRYHAQRTLEQTIEPLRG